MNWPSDGALTLNQRYFTFVDFANWFNIDSTEESWFNVTLALNLEIMIKCMFIDNIYNVYEHDTMLCLFVVMALDP